MNACEEKEKKRKEEKRNAKETEGRKKVESDDN